MVIPCPAECHVLFEPYFIYPSSWTFDICLIADSNECVETPQICSIGTCQNMDGSYKCYCPTGYSSGPEDSECVGKQALLIQIRFPKISEHRSPNTPNIVNTNREICTQYIEPCLTLEHLQVPLNLIMGELYPIFGEKF